jgi:hypothetical protein
VSGYTDYPGQFVRVAGTDRYAATLPLSWDIGKPGSGFTVTVPALYEHDVSIPALLTWAFSRHEPKFQRASRLHDWLLDLGWDRVTSAGIFNDALKADGVSASRRWLMTSAVAFYRWS